MTQRPASYTAFAGTRRIAAGPLAHVARKAKAAVDAGEAVLILDDANARPVEVDFRGTAAEVAARLRPPEAPPTGAPGRPKLGVVAREVTLLPRHWDWLAGQPGGASATLRRLVDEARRTSTGADRRRAAREVAYRAMYALAGNEPGFEEAARALFNGDQTLFEAETARWPADVRDYAGALALDAWA